MRRRAVVAISGIFALVLLACSDATGPGLGVAITAISVSQPELLTTSEGYAQIQCRVTLEAKALGPGRAEWQEATFRWYLGRDSLVLFDSALIAAEEIRDSWGADTLSGSTNQRSSWTVWAGIPFDLEIAYGWTAGGRRGTSTVRFACRPPASPPSTPPAITAMSLRTAGPYEPLDTIRIEFTAASQAGLWQSWVGIGGDCAFGQWTAEQLAHTRTRTVTLAVPSSCAPGSSLTAVAYVQDVDGRDTALGIPLGLLVDRSPPTFSVWIGQRGPAGFFFVGDTLPFTVLAIDNHEVRWVIWEIPALGRRDSVRANAGNTGVRAKPGHDARR